MGQAKLSGKGLWKGTKGMGATGVGQGGLGKGGSVRGARGWNLYFNEVLNKTGIISSN